MLLNLAGAITPNGGDYTPCNFLINSMIRNIGTFHPYAIIYKEKYAL